MEKLDLQREFLRIAGAHGVLGNQQGTIAYGYARVSSALQAEEGASGLPRQLTHLHEAALRERLFIPFDLVFVDDGYSGFRFADRPAFTRLRYELRSNKRADHLIVEEIDRLSRNADWHQGFLLEEFVRREVQIHFYNEPGSELERYIKGYIAQEAMRKEQERMRLGKLYKAMDGRVTATRAAYGYHISDSKDSHYVLDDEEAPIVKTIYDWLTEERSTLGQIAVRLNELQVPGRRGGKWSPGTLLNMVKNEVYKGWFITNRLTYEIVGYDDSSKPKRKWRTRPEEEWIWVPVPAIVSEEQWDKAHEVLRGNRTFSSRRSKGEFSNWLLSGLIECEICHYQYRAARGGTSVKGQLGPIRYYHCGGRWSHKARALGSACRSPYVHAEVLEAAVWDKIQELILHPERVFQVLTEEYTNQQVRDLDNQLAYITSQAVKLEKAKARWDAAYARAIIDIDDYEDKVKHIRAKLAGLRQKQSELEFEYEKLRQESDLKDEIQRRLEGLRSGTLPDLPYDLKRTITTILVDKIVLNSTTGRGIIYGAIPPTLFELHSSPKSRSRDWSRWHGIAHRAHRGSPPPRPAASLQPDSPGGRADSPVAAPARDSAAPRPSAATPAPQGAPRPQGASVPPAVHRSCCGCRSAPGTRGTKNPRSRAASPTGRSRSPGHHRRSAASCPSAAGRAPSPHGSRLARRSAAPPPPPPLDGRFGSPGNRPHNPRP